MIARASPRLLRPGVFFTVFFVLFYILINTHGTGNSYAKALSNTLWHPVVGRMLEIPQQAAANATLGFGAIAVVSVPDSVRQQELIMAAQITGLQVTIPIQPTWQVEQYMGVRAARGSTITQGSALAWLGHLNALNWFLSTNLTTALILEDDVNWDINIRTKQVPRVAAAMRYLMAERQEQAEQAVKKARHQDEYWGSTDNWDILYLGHCGENFRPGKWNFRVRRAGFRDDTLPKRKDMHYKTRDLMDAIDLPEKVRVVHRSIRPLCTFGFAVTRHAAQRLLTEIAPGERDGGTVAYDVRVLEGCRDLGLRCWSTNPELFHHVEGKSEILKIDAKATNATLKGHKRPKSYEELHLDHGAKIKAAAEAEEQRTIQLEAESILDAQTSSQQRLVAESPTLLQKRRGRRLMTRGTGRIMNRHRVVVKPVPVAGVDSPRAANIACGARTTGIKPDDWKTITYLADKVGQQGLCVRNLAEQQEKDRLEHEVRRKREQSARSGRDSL